MPGGLVTALALPAPLIESCLGAPLAVFVRLAHLLRNLFVERSTR